MKALLDYGVDLQARDNNGRNVLWHLARSEKMPASEKKQYSDKIYSLMQK